MTFQEALAQQPLWVQIWVNVMTVVLLGAFVTLLFSRQTRRDALVLALGYAANVAAMLWLHSEFGFVRLLGLPHVLFWTPLVIYFLWRLRDRRITAPFRQVIWLLVAVMVVSLGFDYADVARYLLGETAPLASAPNAPAGG